MKLLTKYLTLAAVIAVTIALTASSRAANLYDASDTLSSLTPGKSAVTHTIRFKPTTSISGPGDLKVSFASEFNLTNVSAAADVTVSGGNVTWNTVQTGDLNIVTNVLTLGWASGTLAAGNQVTVIVKFTKNPSSAGTYNVTIETGPDAFAQATDSRTVPVASTSGGVGVSATVPYPQANPTITNISPAEPVIISSGTSQVISFVITDINNDNVDFSITHSTGTISSVSPSPSLSLTNTSNGVTITFTYFADGGVGSQTITVTADDGVAEGGGLVTDTIDLFII